MTNLPLPPQNPEPPPPPTFDPNLFPPRHRPLQQLLLDHNPLLLLSTVCMLLGCYLVNAALRDNPSDLNLLPLIAVINLYEACIIPLGLLLIRRARGTARDGWWLLLFETLFLVNATFINPDFSTPWAIPLNIALFFLASLKAAIILHYLRIGLSLQTLGFFILQLAIIYGLPIFFYLTKHDGEESQTLMYACWCLVGILPILYEFLATCLPQRHPQNLDLVQNVIRRVYLIAPWLMLLIQLRFSHWAHRSDFSFADLSPVLLGTAIATLRLKKFPDLRIAARALPIFAFFFSLDNGQISFSLPFAGETHSIIPLHLTAAASVLTFCYLVSPFHFLIGLLSVTLITTSYLLQSAIESALRRALQFFLNLVPTTTYTWGITAITTAFLLLAAGTFTSLNPRPKPTPQIPPHPIPPTEPGA